SQRFKLLLQADDSGRNLTGLQPQQHALNFLGDDNLGLAGDLFPAAQVARHHLLKVVNVVEINVIDAVYGRLDIAGHGDIDQEHGTVAASFDNLAHLLFGQDVFGSGRGGDYNVDVAQFGVETLIGNDPRIEQGRHCFRPIERAIGDGNLRSAAALQVARGRFRHLARAED